YGFTASFHAPGPREQAGSLALKRWSAPWFDYKMPGSCQLTTRGRFGRNEDRGFVDGQSGNRASPARADGIIDARAIGRRRPFTGSSRPDPLGPGTLSTLHPILGSAWRAGCATG